MHLRVVSSGNRGRWNSSGKPKVEIGDVGIHQRNQVRVLHQHRSHTKQTNIQVEIGGVVIHQGNRARVLHQHRSHILLWFSPENIATGETSQAITPFHFSDYFHFFDYFDFFGYFDFFDYFDKCLICLFGLEFIWETGQGCFTNTDHTSCLGLVQKKKLLLGT